VRRRVRKSAAPAPGSTLAVACSALEHSGEPTYVLDDGSVNPALAEVQKKDHVLVRFADVEKALSTVPEGHTVFWSPDAPGALFVTSEPVRKDAGVTVLVAPEPEPSGVDESVEKALGSVRVVKDDAAEERFVLGIVLEPETEDSQGDIYSADEIRKTAHGFMENHQQLGKQHTEIVTGKLKILESFIAPCDFEVGTESVKKGTWCMAIRVVDDEMWSGVKKGDLTGFSIGGSAKRTAL